MILSSVLSAVLNFVHVVLNLVYVVLIVVHVVLIMGACGADCGTCAVSPLAFHQGDPGSIPGRVSPDLRMWESYRTMPLVGGSSRGSPISPPFSSGTAPYSPQSPSSALRTSLLRATQISSHTLGLAVVPHDRIKIIATVVVGKLSFELPKSVDLGNSDLGSSVQRFQSIMQVNKISFRRSSILTSITRFGSQDLDVKSRPNLFTLLNFDGRDDAGFIFIYASGRCGGKTKRVRSPSRRFVTETNARVLEGPREGGEKEGDLASLISVPSQRRRECFDDRRRGWSRGADPQISRQITLLVPWLLLWVD
ncbi:hypothetical protein PR048_030299 [Dryococelus australis]|uniref:Uncharacterized protein n=1 Tax=Dryococelus australis TaxID=614101 RepID=A0ABQ9G8K7_9NEOP|nr:hypothetical protein PR048_030299 [Dryococelus australis]